MNLWEVLEIEETTDKKAIRRAYSELVKVYHPEREPEKFQKIYQAYQAALRYAEENHEVELDMWDMDEETESSDMPREKSRFDQIIFTEEERGEHPDASPEEMNLRYEEAIWDQVPYEIEVALTAFSEQFSQENQNEWQEFMVRREFLEVQYQEQFVMRLARFLKEQTLYPMESLPFELVTELYYVYQPCFLQAEQFFGNGFRALQDVLLSHEEIETVLDAYHAPNRYNEIYMNWLYYSLYHNLKKENVRNQLSLWEQYMTEFAHVIAIHNGVTALNRRCFRLLSFLIRTYTGLDEKIYLYLIDRFDLVQAKQSSWWTVAEPFYQAIEEQGIRIQSQMGIKQQRVQDILWLMREVKRLSSTALKEEERAQVHDFFSSELYNKYKLDAEFMNQKFYNFVFENDLFSEVFLDEFQLFYDDLYAKCNSQVGRELYNLLLSKRDRIQVNKDCEVILENRIQWVKDHFFEEGFTRVWRSANKGSMKIVYRTILEDHLKNFAEQSNYEWELYSEGHLYAVKEGDNYVFSHVIISEHDTEEDSKEKVILSMREYYEILEELFEVYTGRYFCTSSEKKKWNELMEGAKKRYGDYRD